MTQFLQKVISGFQTGADIAGIKTAKQYGLEVGGSMTKGYRTLSGPRPEYHVLYGSVELDSKSYAVRTMCNVADSDATVRFATKWNSPGEYCTANCIHDLKKPHIDIGLRDGLDKPHVLAAWLELKQVKVLNVAGNSEQTSPGIEEKVTKFLSETFERMGFKKL